MQWKKYMAPPVVPALSIIPPIVMGLVIGAYEALLIHRDVQVASHRFMHTLHAFALAIAACFFSFNVPLVYVLVPQLKGVFLVGSEVGVRVILGLIMTAKVHGVSAALKGSGMSTAGLQETWFHSLLIGALTAASPYLFPFAQPFLPKWVK